MNKQWKRSKSINIDPLNEGNISSYKIKLL